MLTVVHGQEAVCFICQYRPKLTKEEKSMYRLLSLSLVLCATSAFSEGCPMQKSCSSNQEVAHHENASLVSHEHHATTPDLVDVAVGNKDFSTLVTLVKTAGLVDALKGEGPFTVFAPTNKAFEKLPKETVEFLLSTEGKKELTKILTYHVVPGRVTSADVVKLSEAKTLQGDHIGIKVVDGNVMINDSKVLAVDVEASNGIIHVIDSVLLPSQE